MNFPEFNQQIPSFGEDGIVSALSGEPSGVPCTGHTCPCFSVTLDGTGGCLAGGLADVAGGSEIILGGCRVGSCSGADIDVVDRPYDGLEAIYPLDEDCSGAVDEVKDRTTHQLHGQCGDGTSDQIPTLDDGIFCSCSQLFDGRHFIKFAEDSMSVDHDFSVSGWAKITSFGVERAIFTRGDDTAAVSLQHHFGNGVQAYLNTDSATQYQAFGPTFPEIGRWFHYALSYDGNSLDVFLNGILEESYPVAESSTVSYQGGNFVGQYEGGSFPTGNIQEVRLFPDCRDANYFRAEHDNFCSSGFFVVGDARSGAADM